MANDNNYYVISGETLSQLAEVLRVLDGTSQPLEWPTGFAGSLWSIAGKMVDIQPLNVTQNGTYTAPSGTAYSPVTVSVSGSGTDYLADLEKNTLTTRISTATTVKQYTYYGCTSLQNVSFPNATKVGRYCFCECTNLTSASFPSATGMDDSAFRGCTSLATISFPELVTGSTNYFYGCTSLTNVSFPKLSGIPASGFWGCTSLASASFPAATSIENTAFQNCSSLETVNLPLISRTSQNCFNGCIALESISLPSCLSIYNTTFYGCSNLTVVVLGNSRLCSLGNINAFNNTPFASGGSGGTLYVPQDLIASYQSASNWSTILGYANNQIKAIEGSLYE